jgi:acetyl esterase
MTVSRHSRPRSTRFCDGFENSGSDANFENASYNEFGNGPWLTKPAMKWFWNAYAPNKVGRKKITAAPLLATTEELTGLPPALVMTVLRDEGEAYSRKLTQAGVSLTSVRFLATFHDFAMLNGPAGTPASVSAVRLASEQLAAALKQ